MHYRKIIAELVIEEDDCECTIQQLSTYLERVQEHTTLYRAAIRDEETATPENAAEIAAK